MTAGLIGLELGEASERLSKRPSRNLLLLRLLLRLETLFNRAVLVKAFVKTPKGLKYWFLGFTNYLEFNVI